MLGALLHQVTVLTCVRMLVISWTGNFLGCALMAGLLCASELYHGKTTTLFYIAHDKVSHGWGATLVKGELTHISTRLTHMS